MSDAENTQSDAPAEAPAPTPEQLHVAALRETHSLPAAWTDAQVLAWDEVSAANPDQALQTEAGNWVNDPTRVDRKYVDWATSELLDQVCGRLNPAELSDGATKALVSVLRKRDGVVVNDAWSAAEVVGFLRYDQPPAQTEAGVWINDEVRDTKKAEQWTNDELDAWGRGQIKHGIKASDKFLAIELRKRFLLDATNAMTPAEVKAIYLKKFEASEILGVEETEGLTEVNAAYITSSLEEYKKKVGPNTPVSDTEGAKAQVKLDTVFQYVMGLEGPAFVAGMTALRDFFAENREGLFEQTYLFRFPHLMALPAGKIKRHKDFLELLQVATHENPQLMSQIDIRAYLTAQTEQNAERLIDYFKNYANA